MHKVLLKVRNVFEKSNLPDFEHTLTLRPCALRLAQDGEGLFAREFVFEIGKVERGQDLFGRKIKQQLPKPHAAGFGPRSQQALVTDASASCTTR